MPVFLDGRPKPAFHLDGVTHGPRLWRRAEALDRLSDAQVEVGLPLTNGSIGHSGVLWAWVKGRDQLWRASRFKPMPSLVLRLGASTERLLVWGLRKAVSCFEVAPLNERISYALRAARTHCEPEKLRIPLPGTFLRVGRVNPVPVLVTRFELGCYSAREVAGSLRDAPSRDAWKEAKR